MSTGRLTAPSIHGTLCAIPARSGAEYVESITDEQVVLRNYAGKKYVYKQPAEVEVLVG